MTTQRLAKHLNLYPSNAKRVHRKVTTEHGVEVTPKIAAQWLGKLFEGQRGVSRTHVEVLAAEMKAGVWMDTGSQGIVFDYYDRLIDGQHRLLAIIESGVTVTMSVVRGVDPQAYLHMDENTKVRQASAYLVGFTRPKVCVTAYRLYLDYDNLQKKALQGQAGRGFLAFGRRSGIKWKADREKVLAWCIRHKAQLEHVVGKVTTKEAKAALPPTSVAAGFYLWLYLKNPEKADEFFTRLIEGVDFQGRNDPVYLLQRSIMQLKEQSKASMGTAVPHFRWGGLLITAWNAFISGEKLDKLTFDQRKSWPAILLDPPKAKKSKKSKKATGKKSKTRKTKSVRAAS